MKVIYDYYGLEIFFRDDAKLPMHIYAKRGNNESCLMININNGLFESTESFKCPDELDEADLESFQLLVNQNISEIIKRWIDLFLYRKPVPTEVLKTKLKA